MRIFVFGEYQIKTANHRSKPANDNNANKTNMVFI